MVKFKVEEGFAKFGYDKNDDGQESVSLQIGLAEALQEAIEAFKKGEKKQVDMEAKLVEFKFEGSKLVVKLDTDKDGEKLLELNVDLAEIVDEIL